MRSINDLPDEMLLKILSHFESEDLCLKIAKVCERWNNLTKDVALWRNLSYSCEYNSNFSDIAEVRCTRLLRSRNNYIMNFAPSGVLKVQNLKAHFRNRTSFRTDWGKTGFWRLIFSNEMCSLLVIFVSMLRYNLDCRFCSYCEQRILTFISVMWILSFFLWCNMAEIMSL
jgi:hypothetical protein